jgi:LmbE family N-acetylglucosaminyl deacetylase
VGQWLMLFSTSAPNYVVDITDRWERKKELLAIHASQFSGERLEGVTNLVASRAEEDGDRIGVTHGEGFRCIPIR